METLQTGAKNQEPWNGHQPQPWVAQSWEQMSKKFHPLQNHNLYSVNTNPNPYFWGSVSLKLWAGRVYCRWLTRWQGFSASLQVCDSGLFSAVCDFIPWFSAWNGAVWVHCDVFKLCEQNKSAQLSFVSPAASRLSLVWYLTWQTGSQEAWIASPQSSLFVNLSCPSSDPAGLTLFPRPPSISPCLQLSLMDAVSRFLPLSEPPLAVATRAMKLSLVCGRRRGWTQVEG